MVPNPLEAESPATDRDATSAEDPIAVTVWLGMNKQLMVGASGPIDPYPYEVPDAQPSADRDRSIPLSSRSIPRHPFGSQYESQFQLSKGARCIDRWGGMDRAKSILLCPLQSKRSDSMNHRCTSGMQGRISSISR